MDTSDSAVSDVGIRLRDGEPQRSRIEGDMHIYFIRHETEYGPFFDSKDKAVTYLLGGKTSPETILQIVEGTDPYTDIVEVELNDITVSFDG
jgi:hypothetical protein